MSDPLAEHIYQAAFDRHVIIDRTDCAALAAAARAFIGDELHERYEEEDAKTLPYLTYQEGYKHGLGDAESIARGDTK